MNKKNNILIITILFLGFFMVTSNIVIVSSILKFIKTDLSIPKTLLGAVLAAFPIIAMVSNLILGPFIDKYGRRRMMLIGSSACIVTFVVTSLAKNATMIIISRGLTALCIPMVGASIFPYIVDYFPKEQRVKVMGYVMSASSISAIISIPVGILSSGYFSWRVVFYLLAFVALIFFITAKAYLPAPDVKLIEERITLQTYKRKLLSFSKNNYVMFGLFTKCLCTIGTFVFGGLYPTWLFETFAKMEATYFDIALLFFFCGVGGWIGAVSSGRASMKFSNTTALYIVLALVSGLLISITPLYTKIFYYQHAVYISALFTREMYLPLLQTVLMHSVEPSDRGSLNGVNNAVFQIATGIGVTLSGYLYVMDESFVLNGIVSAFFISASAVTFIFSNEKNNILAYS